MSEPIDLLIVDDAETDAFLLGKAFEMRAGHVNVQPFVGGQEVLDFLKTSVDEGARLPCAILLDINMPAVSGYDVLTAVKSDETLSVIPVIMFSTSESEDDIVQSYALGANAYVQKPSGFDLLLDFVDNFNTFWFKSAKYAHCSAPP